MSFEISQSFYSQFWACRYITGLDRTSVYKVIVIRKCTKLLFSILSVSLYYGSQSDIWVKSYCRLNFLRTSIFNLESLNILGDSIGHPSKTLLSFKFATNFHFEFQVPRYFMGLNRTSCKYYCHLNLLRTSVFNLEHLNILRDSIGHPSKKLLLLEFALSFCFTLPSSWYITGQNHTSELKFIAV